MNEPMVLREWRKLAAEVLDPAAGPVQQAEVLMAWVMAAHCVLAHLNRAPNGNCMSRQCGQVIAVGKVAMEYEERRCKERENGGEN